MLKHANRHTQAHTHTHTHMQTLKLKQILISVSEYQIQLNNDHFNLFLQICPKNYSNQIINPISNQIVVK